MEWTFPAPPHPGARFASYTPNSSHHKSRPTAPILACSPADMLAEECASLSSFSTASSFPSQHLSIERSQGASPTLTGNQERAPLSPPMTPPSGSLLSISAPPLSAAQVPPPSPSGPPSAPFPGASWRNAPSGTPERPLAETPLGSLTEISPASPLYSSALWNPAAVLSNYADLFSFVPLEPTIVADRRRVFHKTQLCKHLERGYCRNGTSCPFAHSREELRPPPTLSKTMICPDVKAGGICQRVMSGQSCSFAHCSQELRQTANHYKTNMCRSFLSGKCLKADKCTHAHGEVELLLHRHRALQLGRRDFVGERDAARPERKPSLSKLLHHKQQPEQKAKMGDGMAFWHAMDPRGAQTGDFSTNTLDIAALLQLATELKSLLLSDSRKDAVQ
ncbi:zinc finger CCCH domain-containing protein 33 [Cyclospora cayetanensis]|uniref:Zinc finger CCCH domain-containing protein 33 n=1 Tax=Cyclospora cayetanensis TaxID=88456 RepID=A0A6P6S0W8_9EIME|nr:zinc finger CCCH domain-containing protein 33 [Cyclospora cayetanensis]